uniref:t-SNARE coiled-coil homology domain-containing protein n=1 Tax=Oryza brachyantha TaxID=4533 RepID=J3MCJ8_ORYBR
MVLGGGRVGGYGTEREGVNGRVKYMTGGSSDRGRRDELPGPAPRHGGRRAEAGAATGAGGGARLVPASDQGGGAPVYGRRARHAQPKDTPSLRGRLRGTRAGIKRLSRSTSQALRQAAAAAARADESVATFSKKAMDLEAVMSEYHKIEQRIAATERQESAAAAAARRSPSSSPPPSSNPYSTSSQRNNDDERLAYQKQQQQIAVPPTQQDLVLLDSDVEFHEAVIAEREQAMQEVQQDIADIHEIFKDLAMLVHDQGECIEIVTSNVDRTAAATSQAEAQLSRAAGIREEEKEQILNHSGAVDNTSKKCLLLTVLGLFLLIMGLVIIS